MLFTNSLFGNCSKDPAVIKFKGQYYLYHSIQPELNHWQIGIAKSNDLEHWEVCDRICESQECERRGICAPGAIVLNDTIHLFYQTYGNGEKDAICHATSTDGIHFVKDAGNPVFRPTNDWCCGRAIDADVCVFNNRLYLYFATRDHKMQIQKLGCAYAGLNTDFSVGCWTQGVNRTILAPEFIWEGACIEAPATIVYDNKIYLFYGGSYNCTPQRIGCAVSDDGVNFEKISNQAFLCEGAEGTWNQCESGHPFVFQNDDGRIYLFYQGSADNGKTWYISKEEITLRHGYPELCGAPQI